MSGSGSGSDSDSVLGSGSASASASGSVVSGTGKKTKGRRKIEIKKIENDDDRMITFSKRRSGIYKKASELSILCGAEVGFMILSPSGKPFSFGQPSFESIADRYLNRNNDVPPPAIPNERNITHSVVEAHRKLRTNQLTLQLNEIHRMVDTEKAKEKELDEVAKRSTLEAQKGWWETPIDELSQKELQEKYSAFEEFRNNLYREMNQKISAAGAGAASSSSVVSPMDPAQLMNNNANNEVAHASFPPSYHHF